MVKLRFFQLIVALIVFAPLHLQVLAQQEIHHGPPIVDPNGYDPDMLQPFIEPLTFDPDFQFFAPANVDQVSSEVEPPLGWFFTYDRVHIYVSRPQDEASYTQGDFTWGNRYDLGYMTDEDHGWLMSFLHIDGPNVNYRLEAERINVFQPQDTINGTPNAIDLRGGGGGGGTANQQTNPGFPLRDRNDPVTRERDYRLYDSINEARVSSFELNKTFRHDPKHYGSIIEPFLGIRYANIDDFYQRDVYERFDETTGALVYSTAVPGLFPPPGTDIDDVRIEQLTSRKTHFDNNMFGGQLGMRWFKQKARWDLSGELRVFAFQNFQSFTTRLETERTQYDGGTNGSDPEYVVYHRFVDSGHAAEFVYGTEVRTEAAYNISKYLQLRAGIQFMDFARGIGRGNDLVRNDQDFLMVGGTFGFTVNR